MGRLLRVRRGWSSRHQPSTTVSLLGPSGINCSGSEVAEVEVGVESLVEESSFEVEGCCCSSVLCLRGEGKIGKTLYIRIHL